ncbi:MAG: hypothetical protein IJP06_03285 [Agathobacter sp.]|nr:hypothetical protein [Agathobacter sp.]
MKQKNLVVSVGKVFITAAVFLASVFLFYRQGTAVEGLYMSDLQDHIAFALAGDSYSLLYFVMGFVLRITGGSVMAIAILEALLVVGTGWVTYLLFSKRVSEEKKSVVFVVSFALLFFTSIYVPILYPHYYIQTFVTQPWHNITYIGMRFFAVLTMYAFFEVYESYLENVTVKQWIGVALPLLCATAIKPNFLLAFSFALLAVLILDFVKNFFDKKKFLNMIKMGTTVFPACAALLVQAVILYGPTDTGAAESGLIITWGATLLQDGFLPLVMRIICGLSFPIMIYVLGHKQLDKQERFVYLMYIITFIQVHMLGESGARATHGNFTWGIYNSAYILLIYTIAFFMEHYSLKKANGKAVCMIGWGILALHLVSGMVYFLLLLAGGPSYLL